MNTSLKQHASLFLEAGLPYNPYSQFSNIHENYAVPQIRVPTPNPTPRTKVGPSSQKFQEANDHNNSWYDGGLKPYTPRPALPVRTTKPPKHNSPQFDNELIVLRDMKTSGNPMSYTEAHPLRTVPAGIQGHLDLPILDADYHEITKFSQVQDVFT